MAKNFTEDDLKRMGLALNKDGSYSKQIVKLGGGQELTIGNPVRYTRELDLTLKKVEPIVKQLIDSYTTLHKGAKPLIVFEIDPIGAPRMTRSDKWKVDPFHPDPKKRQRKPVTQYFKFKNGLKFQAQINNFTLPESNFHVIFHIPMPRSWNEKDRAKMRGSKHQQKPDSDNCIKAVKDSLCDNDAYIWDYRITKLWADVGRIIIYNID